MNTKVLTAVLKRNFVSYFANPTAYLFICLFVLVATFAAFWPNEFFNANLANLDQLNGWFPFIMLMFIPAISMGIWADERRQGTDELLLTIPASDLDVVLGKYLATVAIYTVSLVFSLICNFLVLRILGRPDVGLFLATYFGYWLVGLAMLAVGMVASFLTANLTVAYILGAIFNAPLVFAAVLADAILPQGPALAIKQWSIGGRLDEFGRGIISFSGVVYFLAIAAVMLYLCMVLIGRRHWSRGRGGAAMVGHYCARTTSLVVMAAGAVFLFGAHDARVDVTSEHLSSLSGETVKLLNNLDIQRPVQIEAFISPTVPEEYVRTRLDLLTMLQELKARGRGKVNVVVNSTERFSDEAERAEKRYGITPRTVLTTTRGTQTQEDIFLGVAFTSGLEKVILPFMDPGIPVEYELVRSIATVTQQERRKIGVVKTDAQLFGGFDFMGGGARANWPIVDELKKQYEVVEVDPAKPITDEYDALLAIQPSSLGPAEMQNFIAAVKAGRPAAIFEDPFPVFAGEVPATSAPRQAPGGMNAMFMGQQAPPKGDIRPLWAALGVDFTTDKLIWQDYNPIPKLSQLAPEFVFVDKGEGIAEPFNEASAISSGLQQLLFPFPGAVNKLNVSDLQYTPLVRTGTNTGEVNYWEMLERSPLGGMGLNPRRRQMPTGVSYVLAARIQGNPKNDAQAVESLLPPLDEEENKAVNVVLITDIDMLHREFFEIRKMGDAAGGDISLNFDNVTFVLNTLDVLADDQRFVEIRKRRPVHRTLTEIERRTKASRKETMEAIESARAEFDTQRDAMQKELTDSIETLQADMQKESLGMQEILTRVAMAQQSGQRRLDVKVAALQRQRDKKVEEIERDLDREVRAIQGTYKLWAVILPPILPLLLAGLVFAIRRHRERQGVARTRLRKG